jgi:hypothetical protein
MVTLLCKHLNINWWLYRDEAKDQHDDVLNLYSADGTGDFHSSMNIYAVYQSHKNFTCKVFQYLSTK